MVDVKTSTKNEGNNRSQRIKNVQDSVNYGYLVSITVDPSEYSNVNLNRVGKPKHEPDKYIVLERQGRVHEAKPVGLDTVFIQFGKMKESCNQLSVPLIQVSNAGSSGKMEKAKTLCRVFKKPPQPHMCIQDFLINSTDPCFINVLSWGKLSTPSNPKDPIPLYGGMKVLNHSTNALQLAISSCCQDKEFTKTPVTYAVMANPEVLKVSGKKSADVRDRDAFIDLMLDFVEAMNPGTKFQRKFVVLGDRDLAGELKDIWYTVHNKRQQEKTNHSGHGEGDLSILNRDTNNVTVRVSKHTTKPIGELSVKDLCLAVDKPERELLNVTSKPDKWLCYNQLSDEETSQVEVPFSRDVGREEILEGWNYEYENNGALDIPVQPLFPLNFESSVSSFSESEHISVTSFLEEEKMYLDESVFENCKPAINVTSAASSLDPLNCNYFVKGSISTYDSGEVLMPFEDDGDKYISTSTHNMEKNLQLPLNFCDGLDPTLESKVNSSPVGNISPTKQLVNSVDLDLNINNCNNTGKDGAGTKVPVEQTGSELAFDRKREDSAVMSNAHKLADTIKCKHISDPLKTMDSSSQESLDDDKENSSNENIDRSHTTLQKPLLRHDIDEINYDWQTIETIPGHFELDSTEKFIGLEEEDSSFLLNSDLQTVDKAGIGCLHLVQLQECFDLHNGSVDAVNDSSKSFSSPCTIHTASTETAHDLKCPNVHMETSPPACSADSDGISEEIQNEQNQAAGMSPQFSKERRSGSLIDLLSPSQIPTEICLKNGITDIDLPFNVIENKVAECESRIEGVSFQEPSERMQLKNKTSDKNVPRSTKSNTSGSKTPATSLTPSIAAPKCKLERKSWGGNKTKPSKELSNVSGNKSERLPSTSVSRCNSGKLVKHTLRSQQHKQLPMDSSVIQRHFSPSTSGLPLQTNSAAIRTKRSGVQHSPISRPNTPPSNNTMLSESPKDGNSKKVDHLKVSKSVAMCPKSPDSNVFPQTEKNVKVKKIAEVDRRSKKRPSEKQPSDSSKNKSLSKHHSLDSGSLLLRRHNLHLNNSSSSSIPSTIPAGKTSQNLETSKDTSEHSNAFPALDVAQKKCDHNFKTLLGTSSENTSWGSELPMQTQYTVEEATCFVARNHFPLKTCTTVDYEMENNSEPSLPTPHEANTPLQMINNSDFNKRLTSMNSAACVAKEANGDEKSSDLWDTVQRPRVTVEYLPILNPLAGFSENGSKRRAIKKERILADSRSSEHNGSCESSVQRNNRPELKTELKLHNKHLDLRSTSQHLESPSTVDSNCGETHSEISSSNYDREELQLQLGENI